MEGGSIPSLSNLEEALKSEQKVRYIDFISVLVLYFPTKSCLVSGFWFTTTLFFYQSIWNARITWQTLELFFFFPGFVCSGSSWYRKEEKKSRIKETVCRLIICKTEPSGLWGQELSKMLEADVFY